MDLKSALKEKDKKIKECDDQEYINKHKKPMQLRDIESRSSSNHKKINETYETEKDIHSFIEQEKQSVYFKPWNKLETGHKLNRIRKYVSSIKEERNLDDNEVKKLNTILFDACNSNKLNKVSDITYDKETGEIKEIKILEITEDNNGQKFSLKMVQPKTKSTPKSKSNVDRFLKPGSLKSKK
jgi:hypothetical protein